MAPVRKYTLFTAVAGYSLAYIRHFSPFYYHINARILTPLLFYGGEGKIRHLLSQDMIVDMIIDLYKNQMLVSRK